MFDSNRPQDDQELRSEEMREVIWALELASCASVDSVTADGIWREVKRRAAVRPGAEVIRTARTIWGEVSRGLREVVATLDQRTLRPAAAVRSAGEDRPRVLIYETDQYAVSLTFSGAPEATRVSMIGQIVPKAATSIPEGGRVAVFSDRETSLAAVNEFGEFSVSGVRRGSLHMDLLLGTESIQISPIETSAVRTLEE